MPTDTIEKLSYERRREIDGGLVAFMRGWNRVKDFRNYYKAALRLKITVEELDAFITEREEAHRQAEETRAEALARRERCPHHPERPSVLKIVVDQDDGGLALVCPRCRYSRYLPDTTPAAYLAGLGVNQKGEAAP